MKISLSRLLHLITLLALALTSQLILSGQIPLTGGARSEKLDDYRQFAVLHDGDVSHGQLLFVDEKGLACAKCHSIDGKGAKIGPDLFALGDRFSRREIIDSILLPSAAIAVGYATTSIETKSLGDS